MVFGTEPAGQGALTVTAHLGGVATAAVDGAALRLTLTDGSELRMGQVVVKDATGTELHRGLPTVDGSTIRLGVPSDVLDTATYSLTVDPTVSGERVLAEPISMQSDADSAFDGTNYCVVWYDTRNGTSDIYGARVAPDGTVLDPGGFLVTTFTEGSNQFEPVVEYFGPHYLVVWSDDVAGGTNRDIKVARVRTNGTVLDTIAAPFSTATFRQTNPGDCVRRQQTGIPRRLGGHPGHQQRHLRHTVHAHRGCRRPVRTPHRNGKQHPGTNGHVLRTELPRGVGAAAPGRPRTSTPTGSRRTARRAGRLADRAERRAPMHSTSRASPGSGTSCSRCGSTAGPAKGTCTARGGSRAGASSMQTGSRSRRSREVQFFPSIAANGDFLVAWVDRQAMARTTSLADAGLDRRRRARPAGFHDQR